MFEFYLRLHQTKQAPRALIQHLLLRFYPWRTCRRPSAQWTTASFSHSWSHVSELKERLCSIRNYSPFVLFWLWGSSRLNFRSCSVLIVRASIGFHLQETQHLTALLMIHKSICLFQQTVKTVSEMYRHGQRETSLTWTIILGFGQSIATKYRE